MNKKKIVIAILILIGLLFLVAFGAGFKVNREPAPDPPKSYKPGGLMKGIGDLMAPFAPSVNADRLRCNDQPMETIFLLTRDKDSCVVSIPPSKEQYRKGTLRMTSAKGPAVEVEYRERNGEEGEATTLTADEPLRLVFLEEGGRLTLTCKECKTSGRSVRLKLE